MATGLNWKNILAALGSETWETDRDDESQQTRQIFIGTVFALYPSGKYYTPFAHSNVNPCEACRGTGQYHIAKRRLVKKWKAAQKKAMALAQKNHLIGNVDGLRRHSWYRYYRNVRGRLSNLSCQHCGGMGSREAYLDSIFAEELEQEASAIGCYVMGGEGDPCDIFVGETRQRPSCEHCGDYVDDEENDLLNGNCEDCAKHISRRQDEYSEIEHNSDD